MPLDQSENFVRGGVVSGIGSVDSEVTVDDASIYPALSGGRYNVVAWDAGNYAIPGDDPDREILRVTGRDAANDVLTVNRGQENTSASIHQETSSLMMSPTAKMFQDIQRNAAGITTLEAEDMASGTKRYHRDYVADDEVFSLYKIGPLDRTGSATSGISASVLDASDDSSYYSTTAPAETGDPLKKVYGPASLKFELSADVSGADVSARWKYDVSPGTAPDIQETWNMFQYNRINEGTSPNSGDIAGGSTNLLWSVNIGSQITAPTIVYDGTVYSVNYSGVLYALDESDGSTQWTYDTGNNHQIAPVYYDGKIILNPAQAVYAVDADDGSELWANSTLASDENERSHLTEANGTIYVGNRDYNLYAIDPADGTEKWSFNTGNWVDATPAYNDGLIYTGTADFFAVNESDGSQAWSYSTADDVLGSPTVKDGLIFFGTGDGKIIALNESTESLEWDYSTSGTVEHSPAVYEGVVYAGDFDNNIFALDAMDGTIQWETTPLNSFENLSGPPVVQNGSMYFVTDDGNFYSINTADGTKEWSDSLGTSTFKSSPAVANDRLYVGSGGGDVYAYE